MCAHHDAGHVRAGPGVICSMTDKYFDESEISRKAIFFVKAIDSHEILETLND